MCKENKFKGFLRFRLLIAVVVLAGSFNAGCATLHKQKNGILDRKKAYVISTVGDCKFPIIFVGESITSARSIDRVEFFLPTFGKERPAVNPAMPMVEDRHLIKFEIPGEYYLKFNHRRRFLKVLVLSRDEPISKAVLRIFDFSVANMLYCANHDQALYLTRDNYISEWFESEGPAMLMCGPTMWLFQRIIQERLELPTRNVTFPGTFYYPGGEKLGNISYISHNMPEIYLPDIGKFVLFDLNNSFVPRWLDAIEFSKKIHEQVGDTIISTEAWKSMDVDIYHHIESFQASQMTFRKVVNFKQSMISKNPATVNWPSLFQGFSGGVAYWGGELTWVKPTGTEFLPGEYLYASLHEDAGLKEAAIKWIESFKIKPSLMTPAELTGMLAEGHKENIAAKRWLFKLPQQWKIRE